MEIAEVLISEPRVVLNLQCSSLQMLHKKKSIPGNVARRLPRIITINKGKEGMMKAEKYTSAQTSVPLSTDESH